jgi:general secretion pathway protein K
MIARASEGGVVLVNVLVVLAIAGGLMLLLIGSQEASLDRISRSADASIAEQIALGAEASVLDALRRDLDDAPDIDHLNEVWAQSVMQEAVELPTGTFSVQITDLQAKFDINQLAITTAGTQDFAQRLMVAVEQPPEIANQIGRILGAIGRVADLRDLATFGIPETVLDALSPYVTALPVGGTINLNSVDPFLLSVMLQNQAQAAQVIRLRERRGHVSLQSLRDAGVLRPQNSGFTSNVYLVDVLAEAGSARLQMRTLILRRNEPGLKAVEILERRLVPASPPLKMSE